MGWMAALTLLTLGLPSSAGARPPGPEPSLLDRVERVIDRLSLDLEIETAVYAALDGARTELRGRRGEIRAAHEEMRELLAQTEPDETAVINQVDVISAAMSEARKASLHVFLAVREMLPEEQRQELSAALHPREREPASKGPRIAGSRRGGAR